jgi:tetratricopeptide (TPR) repeat protein
MLEDLFQLRERARAALRAGDLDAATTALMTAAQQTHVPEADYHTILRPLADVLRRRNDARGALSVQWYLAWAEDGWAPTKDLLPLVPPVDRARTLAAMGDMAAAAREMEDAGLVAAAAIYREKAEDWRGARALWARLSQSSFARGASGTVSETSSAGAGAYQAALVQFNLARCAKQCGDPRQAREAIVAAVRLLEEAADHFESMGQRERAFDCFQVLAQIGREANMFEDVLEGFVNCIRILREDHLKYFALQYFEDALTAATERGELSAAATLAREAGEYARSLGMVAAGLHYTLLQAELWRKVAEQHGKRGAPPEIAENAVLAAVLAFGEVGQFARVGKLYSELSGMDLEPTRKNHYARAAARYVGVPDEPIDAAPLPTHLRQDNHFPDVWHIDVLEWEQHGSAVEACADVLLDKRWPDLIRRKALLARLTAFHAESPQGRSAQGAPTRARLAEQLSDLQLYAVLSPLESLFDVPERTTRVAVLAAMQKLFFKRSFVTVRAGLRDADPAVVAQAAKAVESLYFQHAFDPLVRIVREAPQPEVRASALRAMARVDTIEAAEFLYGVLEHGAPAERTAAVEGLKRARGIRFVELAKAQMPLAAAEMQAALREVLRERSVAA